MMKWCVFVFWGMASVAMGEPITVVCAEFSAAQCKETRLLVKAVEAKASELFRDDFSEYEDDAMIELHLQLRDYQNADKSLNDGRFRNNWSFANASAMQGHIALQPPVPTELLDAAGIPVQTKLMVGQVATHLLRYRAFPNFRSHPEWFTEGLAFYISVEAAHSVGMMGSLEDEPWTSTHIVRIAKLLEENPKVTIETILNKEDIKDVSSGREYALRGLFLIWLDEIGALPEVIDEARRLGGGSAYVGNLNNAVAEAIAMAGVEKSDSAFRAWLGEFSPMWEERYRSLQTSGDVWMHGAFSRNNAVAWNAQELGSRDWEMTGSLKVFEGDKAQMNILLGKSDSGYISVAIGPSFGVTVFHRQYTDNGKKSKWVRLIHKDMKTLELNEWSDFKISKRQGRLMIKINKERPVRIELGEIDVAGQWGLGVQNKSAGLWRDVKVER